MNFLVFYIYTLKKSVWLPKLHRTVKKFLQLAIIHSQRGHVIQVSTSYIRGTRCDILWKVSSFQLILKMSFGSRQ